MASIPGVYIPVIGALAEDGDGSSVTVKAENSSTEHTLAERFAYTVNVKDFGAKGDGIADDIVAIVAAIAEAATAGKAVRLPAGTYRVSSSLTLPIGTILSGDGPGKTIFRFDNPASGRLFTLANVSKVQVRDLTIDGNHTIATSDFSIYVYGSTDCLFNNVAFLNLAGTNSGCLLIAGGSNGIVVDACRFLDAEATAVGITEPTTSFNTIRNNEIQRSGGFGIRLGEGSHRNLIEGNWTTNNAIELIGIANSAYENQIKHNRAEGCGDNGISVSGNRNLVEGNVCRNNFRAGIYLWGSHNTVTGNECINNNVENTNPWPGIGMSANYGSTGQHNTVTGNVIDDDRNVPRQYGIRVDSNAYPLWTAEASIAAGTYVYYGLNIYYTGNGGVTGVTPPTHTNGSITDGTVSWTYRNSFDTNVTFGFNTIVGNDVGRFAGSGPYSAQFGWGPYQNILVARSQSHLGPANMTGDVNVSGSLRVGALSSVGYSSVQDIYIKRPGNAGVLIEPGGYSTGYLSFGNGVTVNGRLRYENSGNLLVAVAAGNDIAYWGSGVYAPGADNAVALGNSSRRWTQLSAATGTINTSDARHKFIRGPLTTAEQRVAQRLAGSIQVYQWLDAVAAKGADDARLHIGWIAQDVAAAFAAEGLDASRYALWCADPETEEVEETVEIEVPAISVTTEIVENIEIRDGVPVLVQRQERREHTLYDDLQVVDEQGIPVFRDGFPMVHRVPHMTKTMVTRKIQAPVKGEDGQFILRLGIRPDQVIAFILAGMAMPATPDKQ